jgi:hypothetical protein
MRAWAAAGVAGFVFGCFATPQMTAVDLAGRASRNLLEAQQSLAGKMVVVSGVVRETTLASRSRVEIDRSVGGWSATATQKEERVPLVVLEPGSVLCYFEPSNIGDASSLKGGDPVSLECEVQYFKDVQEMRVSVLAACRRP